jgi:hypothetical protein
MMKKLPFAANLEFLKHEARATQKRLQTTLSHAQFILAKEYGFSSWTRLKIYVEALAVRGHSPTALCQKILGLLPTPNALSAAFARLPLADILALRQTLTPSQLAEVVSALRGALHHIQPRVRFDAAMALDHLCDDTCTSELLACYQTPSLKFAALHFMLYRVMPAKLCHLGIGILFGYKLYKSPCMTRTLEFDWLRYKPCVRVAIQRCCQFSKPV